MPSAIGDESKRNENGREFQTGSAHGRVCVISQVEQYDAMEENQNHRPVEQP